MVQTSIRVPSEISQHFGSSNLSQLPCPSATSVGEGVISRVNQGIIDGRLAGQHADGISAWKLLLVPAFDMYTAFSMSTNWGSFLSAGALVIRSLQFGVDIGAPHMKNRILHSGSEAQDKQTPQDLNLNKLLANF